MSLVDQIVDEKSDDEIMETVEILLDHLRENLSSSEYSEFVESLK